MKPYRPQPPNATPPPEPAHSHPSKIHLQINGFVISYKYYIYAALEKKELSQLSVRKFAGTQHTTLIKSTKLS